MLIVCSGRRGAWLLKLNEAWKLDGEAPVEHLIEHVAGKRPLALLKRTFALVDGKFVTIRVPYPMGFFAKWAEGRIDDPNGGWKGRSLWATDSTRTIFHSEGGTKNRPKVYQMQLRPDPLAR